MEVCRPIDVAALRDDEVGKSTTMRDAFGLTQYGLVSLKISKHVTVAEKQKSGVKKRQLHPKKIVSITRI